ncbi:YegP family protein [Lysinibacillus sp. Y5S-8]|uniref:YegP family protein n=1 Tax=unclassified Lysinibacillus TaxID=2636778 RepID=UPI0030CDBC18
MFFSNTNPKFEILRATNNQYYFVLKAPNGEIIATSETYTTKENCKNGINSVKVNAPKATVVDNS